MFRDESSVELADGAVLSISDAIDRLPWVTAYCPTMPHQYVVSSLSDCDPVALTAILTMIRDSSKVVPAYWRGYPTPTRYWHGPGGFRYWISAGIFPSEGDTVLNRTDAPDDTRPVATGGKPDTDWVGAPWALPGQDVYEWVPALKDWWPSANAIRAGYRPCLACRRRPWTPEEKLILGDAYEHAVLKS